MCYIPERTVEIPFILPTYPTRPIDIHSLYSVLCLLQATMCTLYPATQKYSEWKEQLIVFVDAALGILLKNCRLTIRTQSWQGI